MKPFVFVLCLFGLLLVLRKKKPARDRTAPVGIALCFDADGIEARYGNGERRRLAWDELGKVGVRTTDDGPFADDVFVGLHRKNGELAMVYPQGARGDGALLAELMRRLPDFDQRTFIEAMGSTTNAFFVVWEEKTECNNLSPEELR